MFPDLQNATEWILSHQEDEKLPIQKEDNLEKKDEIISKKQIHINIIQKSKKFFIPKDLLDENGLLKINILQYEEYQKAIYFELTMFTKFFLSKLFNFFQIGEKVEEFVVQVVENSLENNKNFSLDILYILISNVKIIINSVFKKFKIKTGFKAPNKELSTQVKNGNCIKPIDSCQKVYYNYFILI